MKGQILNSGLPGHATKQDRKDFSLSHRKDNVFSVRNLFHGGPLFRENALCALGHGADLGTKFFPVPVALHAGEGNGLSAEVDVLPAQTEGFPQPAALLD